jgi:hypothetical protein
MRIEEINNRLKLLQLCLQYSSQESEKLSIVDRMFVNQERGQLLRELEEPETVPRPVPENIESKIQSIKTIINQTGWTPENNEKR